MLYAIEDEDKARYEDVKLAGGGSENLQSLIDAEQVVRRPPVFEVTNAQSLEILTARVDGQSVPFVWDEVDLEAAK